MHEPGANQAGWGGGFRISSGNLGSAVMARTWYEGLTLTLDKPHATRGLSLRQPNSPASNLMAGTS